MVGYFPWKSWQSGGGKGMVILNVYTVPNLESVISSPIPYPHPMVFFCLSIFFTFPWIILCLLPLNPVHFHLLNHSHIRLILEFLPCGSGGKKICLQCGRPGFDPWIRKIPWSKEMATHSRILVRRIPWTQEPGGLQFTGSQRVGRDWATNTDTPRVRCCGCSGEQKRRASPLGASPFEEESQRLF